MIEGNHITTITFDDIGTTSSFTRDMVIAKKLKENYPEIYKELETLVKLEQE